VQFRADARNERSQRLLEKIGTTREGVLRQNQILPDGHVRDTVYHSIVRAEWPACKRQLEDLLAEGST
jgi:RimJ/RimL family protein N-acetyltransferase